MGARACVSPKAGNCFTCFTSFKAPDFVNVFRVKQFFTVKQFASQSLGYVSFLLLFLPWPFIEAGIVERAPGLLGHVEAQIGIALAPVASLDAGDGLYLAAEAVHLHAPHGVLFTPDAVSLVKIRG